MAEKGSLEKSKPGTNTIRANWISVHCISVSLDKLQIEMGRLKEAVEAKWSFAGPLGLFLGTLPTVLFADFRTALGVPPEYWFALFVVLASISGGWTVCKVFLFLPQRKVKISSIITELKKASEEQHKDVEK